MTTGPNHCKSKRLYGCVKTTLSQPKITAQRERFPDAEESCGTRGCSRGGELSVIFKIDYFFFRVPVLVSFLAVPFLVRGLGATFGFSLPPIRERASAALNGKRRSDNCEGTPGASTFISTRRFAARTIVRMFVCSLLFSPAVSEGSSSIDCFTLSAESCSCLPSARVSMLSPGTP